jgi:hypothetical protein
MGAKPIKAIHAEHLIKKPIISYHPDEYHYTRLIGENPHEKIMFGTVNLSKDEKEILANLGIDISDLTYESK